MHRRSLLASLACIALAFFAFVPSAHAQWISGDITYVLETDPELTYTDGNVITSLVSANPPRVGITALAQGEHFHIRLCRGRVTYNFRHEFRQEGATNPSPYFNVSATSRTTGSVGGGGTVTTPDGWYNAWWSSFAGAIAPYSSGYVGLNQDSEEGDPSSFSRISQPAPLVFSVYPSQHASHLAYLTYTLSAMVAGHIHDDMPEPTPGWLITGGYSAGADAYHDVQVASPQYP